MNSNFLRLFYTSCVQCPRKCGVERSSGKRGGCGETDDVRAALACLHFGEEPVLTVNGGSGTIFFTGCTLRCAFCQNYQISQQGFGKALCAEEFAQICLKLQALGAENINLVTGSHFIPTIAEFIRFAKKEGCLIPFCWNSSGYESVEMLELLKGCVSIWLPDLKTLDKNISKKLFDAEDYPETASAAVSWMIKNFPLKFELNCDKEKMLEGVIVRHLFLPGKFEQTAEVLSWLKDNADGRACISLMSQYTPVPFKENDEKLKKRKNMLSAIENRLVNCEEDGDLRDLTEVFDFEYLFYQELNADTDWLPDFTRKAPFSNTLAVPVWHCSFGFSV